MGNVHMEATQVNYREGNKKMSVAEAIKNAGSEITPEEKAWIDTIPELASKVIIAPEFDAEAGTYAIGDLVMYEGKLYEFTSAHETPGDWDETEVEEKTVADEIVSLKSGLTNLIVIASKTVTTDSDGDASLDINSLDGLVISASAMGVIVTPWVHTGDYKWYVRVMGLNGNPFTGDAAITYAYVQRNQ